ncbi:MAG: LapA family protein [Zoogloeaceae bacterium]|jgi:uncharacterized integral membrane protein|nr:LapA family protein [Zoogloeaceae bacterium]
MQMRILTILTWAMRLFIFLFLFIFALKNTASVELNFFFGKVWELPLVLMLLGFFAGGIVLGVLSMVPPLFRARRAAAALRRDLARLAKSSEQAEVPVILTPLVEP